jgi:hypothetical protein
VWNGRGSAENRIWRPDDVRYGSTVDDADRSKPIDGRNT